VEETPNAAFPPARPLDATLVAGMFFQVLLEAEELPSGASDRVSFIRTKAKAYLVDQLSGQITLSQFFRLLDLIEENVHRYFSRTQTGWLSPAPPPPVPAVPVATLREERGGNEELRDALALLPIAGKGRRKFTREGLYDFLRENEGKWFRLLDFEEHFQVNKKTAWLYLDLLLKAGVLEHNGERANRVRYTLAARYRGATARP
jgi:hypothetical protein